MVKASAVLALTCAAMVSAKSEVALEAEFVDKLHGMGYKYAATEEHLNHRVEVPLTGDLPESIDWTDEGAVSPVRDQGMAESCWAFSAAGAVEGARVAAGAKLADLSPQELMDCMGIACNDGSGTMNDAFTWVAEPKQNGTMDSWTSYPYVDAGCTYYDIGHVCHNGLSTAVQGAYVTDYHHTIVGNETDLMLALTRSPVSVAIFASLPSFKSYTSGVYSDESCETIIKPMLNHGVLAVGYGTTATGQGYWKIKNSWGKSWGENGYIRMARGTGSNGMCGLLIDASQPIVTL